MSVINRNGHETPCKVASSSILFICPYSYSNIIGYLGPFIFVSALIEKYSPGGSTHDPYGEGHSCEPPTPAI